MPVTLTFSATDRFDTTSATAARFRLEPSEGIYAGNSLVARYDPRNRQWDYNGRAYDVITAEEGALVTLDTEGSPPPPSPRFRYQAGTRPEITAAIIEPAPVPRRSRAFSPIPREPGYFHTVTNAKPLVDRERQRLPLTSHGLASPESL